MGTISGQTRERIYVPSEGGRKISQLDWKYNNAAIVKGAVDWDLISSVSLGASGWTTIARRNGNMDDYDWFLASQDKWTHRSTHPDTKLNDATQYDLNIKHWIVKQPDWRVGLMAGYEENRYSFLAKGGTYNYFNGENTGTLPNGVAIIGYKQKFKLPYIGLTAKYRYKDLEVDGTFKYSGLARSSATDEHYLRNTTFTSKSINQNYYSLASRLGYYVTDNAQVYLEGVWSRVTNKKGSLITNDRDNQITRKLNGGSGTENYSMMATAGLRYLF